LTLKKADMIFVLDYGRIVQRGTHTELLAQPGLYRDIYDLQLRDQEEFMAAQDEQLSVPVANSPVSNSSVKVDAR
jgi:ATP-binding cassette subfamily B protein